MSSLGAYMYLYALLPLRLSFSTNFPSAIHLLPHFASVANTEPTLSYIHIGIFAEKRKKIGNPDQVFWITAGICRTVFEDFLLFGQYRTWCILRIMNDSGAAQRAQVWFFPFLPFLFLSFSSSLIHLSPPSLPPLGLGLSNKRPFLNSIYLYLLKGFLYHLYLLYTSLAFKPLFPILERRFSISST